MRKGVMFCTTIIAACGALLAQPKSAVEFYDTNGTVPTGRIGWTGSPSNGNIYIETPPGNSTPLTVKQGNLTVPGSVTAKEFTGDGSKLTGINATATATKIPVDSVKGLTDSLAAKASKNHTHTATSITGTGTADGQVWKWSNSNSAGYWGTDLTSSTTGPGSSIVGVAADSGLQNKGTTTDIKLGVKYAPGSANSGTAETVARSDHKHMAADIISGTLTESQISNGSYMINAAGSNGQVWISAGSGRGS